MTETDKRFSVIIRCKNEGRWIGHTIQSVIEKIEHTEIIVVDNGSSDDSLEIVRSFATDPSLNSSEYSKNYTDIKIVNIEDYSPGKAINLGVRHATNDLIMVISSHCVLKKFNMKTTLVDLDHHDAIFGNQIPVYNGKKITKRYLWSHFGSERVVNLFSDQEGRYFFHNALSIFKKETLVKYPFNEALVGKEDRYWAIDLVEQGGKTLYDPSLEVDHHYTPNGNTWKGIG